LLTLCFSSLGYAGGLRQGHAFLSTLDCLRRKLELPFGVWL